MTMKQKKLRILHVGAECMPYAAAGGLGDVLGSLPRALAEAADADVRVALPLYGCVGTKVRARLALVASLTVPLVWRRQPCRVYSLQEGPVTVYFIENDFYFGRENIYGYGDDGERFAFFCTAVLEMLPRVGFSPQVLHAHDWHAALAVHDLHIHAERRIKTVFSIHNITYQGVFPAEVAADALGFVPDGDPVNLLADAVALADRVTTVSPTYAGEICTPEFGCGLDGLLRTHADKLSGICNGIDTEGYNPVTDPWIYANYSAQTVGHKWQNKRALQERLGLPVTDAPLLAAVSRLVEHKGMDLLCTSAWAMMQQEVQFVILGTGEVRYEEAFLRLASEYPAKLRACICYDRALARQIYAGADLFLMPSKAEPCGLSQLIAARYGTLPVVRRTGGLADTIHDFCWDDVAVTGNGFTFEAYDSTAFCSRISDALAACADPALRLRLAAAAMGTDVSWRRAAQEYLRLYEELKQR